MKKAAGRNDPCPCGSGKKYKKCCLGQDAASEKVNKPIFRFEPGSYGGRGGYMPSLANLKSETGDQWSYYFVLVKPESILDDEDAAVAEAHADLDVAFAIKERGGSDADVAMALRGMGYLNVDDFKVVTQRHDA